VVLCHPFPSCRLRTLLPSSSYRVSRILQARRGEKNRERPYHAILKVDTPDLTTAKMQEVPTPRKSLHTPLYPPQRYRSLEEKIRKQEAHQTQRSNNLQRHALGRLHPVRNLVDRLIARLTLRDLPHPQTSFLRVRSDRSLCIRQLRLQLVVAQRDRWWGRGGHRGVRS